MRSLDLKVVVATTTTFAFILYVICVALLSALYVGLFDLFGRRLPPSPR